MPSRRLFSLRQFARRAHRRTGLSRNRWLHGRATEPPRRALPPGLRHRRCETRPQHRDSPPQSQARAIRRQAGRRRRLRAPAAPKAHPRVSSLSVSVDMAYTAPNLRLRSLEAQKRTQKFIAIEVWPQGIGHVKLRIRHLPQQEIRQAHLARRTNYQVRIGTIGGIKAAPEFLLGKLVRGVAGHGARNGNVNAALRGTRRSLTRAGDARPREASCPVLLRVFSHAFGKRVTRLLRQRGRRRLSCAHARFRHAGRQPQRAWFWRTRSNQTHDFFFGTFPSFPSRKNKW